MRKVYNHHVLISQCRKALNPTQFPLFYDFIENHGDQVLSMAVCSFQWNEKSMSEFPADGILL